MPIFVLPPDPDASARWPGHALFFEKPICCWTDLKLGRGITRSYDLGTITCAACRALIEATNAMTPPRASP